MVMGEPVNPTQEWVQAQSTPHRFLLVDDDPLLLEVVRRLSHRHNCTLDVARDGRTALEMASIGKYRLVFLDYKLDGMDGMDVFRELVVIRPDLPVAFLSGYLDTAMVAKAQKIGFALFICKPDALTAQFFDSLFKALGVPRLGDGPEN